MTDHGDSMVEREELRVEHIMHRIPEGLPDGASLYEAARTLGQYSLSYLPVQNGQQSCVGIVSENDILKQIARCFQNREDPRTVPVTKFMVRQIVLTTAETLVKDAGVTMADNGVRCLPVVSPEGKVIGVVLPFDIIGGLCSSRRPEKNLT